MNRSATFVRPLAEPVAGLGEGPRWDPVRQDVLWVDIPRGTLHRTHLGSGATTSREIGAPLSLALPARDGSVLLARGHGLLSIPGGAAVNDAPVEIVGLELSSDTRLNDGIWDLSGGLMIGSMVFPDREGTDGGLWRIRGGRAPEVIRQGLRLSNGLAWDVDRRRLYHVDTGTRTIWCQALTTDGRLAPPTAWVEIEPGVGNPDGISIDADGHVWVALFGGWSVRRYDPDGGVESTLHLPVQHPTACAFVGPDLDRMVVTTASNRLAPTDRTQPLAGRLLLVDPMTTGAIDAFGRPPASAVSPFKASP